MTRSKAMLERARRALPPPRRDAYERLLRRRDRKRRNARIGAAVLGLLIAASGLLVAVKAFNNRGRHPKPASSCAPMPSDLTHWWPGDGSGADVVGHRPATLHKDATFGPGLIGQAFVLDGEGDFVSVPDDPSLDLGIGDFTIALWASFEDIQGEQILVEKWVQRSFEPEIVKGWTFTKLSGNRIAFATVRGFSVESMPLDIPRGTWIHFAARRNGDRFQIFMNGQQIASRIVPDGAVLDLDSLSSLKFGHRGGPRDTPGSISHQGDFLHGRIDDVKLVVGRALSNGEIESLVGARTTEPAC